MANSAFPCPEQYVWAEVLRETIKLASVMQEKLMSIMEFVNFANWREALHDSGLSSGIQTVYTMAVQGYLDYCAHNAISVTTESARAYMDDVTRRGLARHPELC